MSANYTPYGSACAQMMRGPANAPRRNLQSVVRRTPAQLEAATRHLMTLAKVYAERKRYEQERDAPPSNVLPNLYTKIERVRPGEHFKGLTEGMTVADYVRQFEVNAGLKPVEK